jgi:hypothetical protein
MAAEVLILRGISGSGKTYTAREHESLTPQTVTVHDLKGFLKYVQEEDTLVIVDAKNLRVRDIAPYYAVAEAYGCDVRIETHFIDPMQARRNNDKLNLETLLSEYAVLMSEGAAFPPASVWKHTVEIFGGSLPLNNMNELEMLGQNLSERILAYREKETIREDQKKIAAQGRERASDENYSDDNESFDDGEV